MREVIIYSDGSCLNNPGPGGWASILTCNGVEKMIGGGEIYTTNNRMELTAVIQALQMLKYPCMVTVITDSKYVTDAFNKKWIENWEKTNFVGRKNEDLWRILRAIERQHTVTFTWVKGHAGHHYNELCDSEANRQAQLIQNQY